MQGNLVFNMVRETQDHGSFNSWDRQPFYYASEEAPNGMHLLGCSLLVRLSPCCVLLACLMEIVVWLLGVVLIEISHG